MIKPNTKNGVDHVFAVIGHKYINSDGSESVLNKAIISTIQNKFEYFDDTLNSGIIFLRIQYDTL